MPSFVAGTSVADLRKGPGHYSESAALCSTGNAAIAGHRTTYDAPFGDIQNLAFGDEIQINTPYGNCIYMVVDKFIVEPKRTLGC
ncbi:MAG: class E sortase [Acidimicrobiales bacterium]